MIKDYRGTAIEPGARVAFNRSGEVRLGVVERVAREGCQDWRSYARADVRVRDDEDGKESRVGDPRNMVVLPTGRGKGDE